MSHRCRRDRDVGEIPDRYRQRCWKDVYVKRCKDVNRDCRDVKMLSCQRDREKYLDVYIDVKMLERYRDVDVDIAMQM